MIVGSSTQTVARIEWADDDEALSTLAELDRLGAGEYPALTLLRTKLRAVGIAGETSRSIDIRPNAEQPLIVCARVKCGTRFFYIAERGMRATLCLDCADELLGTQHI